MQDQIEQARRRARGAEDLTRQMRAARPRGGTISALLATPGGNNSLYTPTAESTVGAFAPYAPVGAADTFGVPSSRVPMPAMGNFDAIAAANQPRRDAETARKQRVSDRLLAGQAAQEAGNLARVQALGYKDVADYRANDSYSDKMNRAVAAGTLDPQKFYAAREKRDTEQALRKQRAFAASQLRRGTLYNEDGSIDMAGSAMARLLRTDPQAAGAMGLYRDDMLADNALARDKFGLDTQRFNREGEQWDQRFNREGEQQTFVNKMMERGMSNEEAQQEFQNRLAQGQFDRQGTQWSDEQKLRERDQEFREGQADALLKQAERNHELEKQRLQNELANGEITREQAQQQMELNDLQMQQVQGAIDQSQYMNELQQNIIGQAESPSEGLLRWREASEGALQTPQMPMNTDAQIQRLQDFTAAPQEVQNSMIDQLLALPPSEQQAFMQAAGISIGDLTAAAEGDDAWMTDSWYENELIPGTTSFIDSVTPDWLIPFDDRSQAEARNRRSSAAQQFLEEYRKPSSTTQRYEAAPEARPSFGPMSQQSIDQRRRKPRGNRKPAPESSGAGTAYVVGPDTYGTMSGIQRLLQGTRPTPVY